MTIFLLHVAYPACYGERMCLLVCLDADVAAAARGIASHLATGVIGHRLQGVTSRICVFCDAITRIGWLGRVQELEPQSLQQITAFNCFKK